MKLGKILLILQIEASHYTSKRKIKQLENFDMKKLKGRLHKNLIKKIVDGFNT